MAMKPSEKGAIQSTLVVAISIVTLVVLAVTITKYVHNQIVQRAEEKKLTQEMAEYGMTLALKKISENPSWNEGFANVPYKDGYYTVVIEKTGERDFKAVSSGFIRNVKTTYVCVYRLETLPDSTVKPKPLSWEYL